MLAECCLPAWVVMAIHFSLPICCAQSFGHKTTWTPMEAVKLEKAEHVRSLKVIITEEYSFFLSSFKDFGNVGNYVFSFVPDPIDRLRVCSLPFSSIAQKSGYGLYRAQVGAGSVRVALQVGFQGRDGAGGWGWPSRSRGACRCS